jgi:hypothetical protein
MPERAGCGLRLYLVARLGDPARGIRNAWYDHAAR